MDLCLFNLINGLAGKLSWLDSLAVFFARYFEYSLLLGLVLLLIISFKKYWKTVIQALISAFLARFIIVGLIRWIWPRPRPFVDNSVNLLIDYPEKASFPSGHAAFYFALSALVYLCNKRIGIVFFAASSLICLARIFVGIHWPSDILAGIIVGLLSGWLVYIIFKKRF